VRQEITNKIGFKT